MGCWVVGLLGWCGGVGGWLVAWGGVWCSMAGWKGGSAINLLGEPDKIARQIKRHYASVKHHCQMDLFFQHHHVFSVGDTKQISSRPPLSEPCFCDSSRKIVNMFSYEVTSSCFVTIVRESRANSCAASLMPFSPCRNLFRICFYVSFSVLIVSILLFRCRCLRFKFISIPSSQCFASSHQLTLLLMNGFTPNHPILFAVE